ncbi:MAG: hypothetical protein ACYDBJ_09985 [Aggregatilineales bacterium]
MAVLTRSDPDVSAFTRHMEAQSFDAYREWPIFLCMREAQLRQLLVPPTQASQSPTGTAAGSPQKERIKL